MIDPGDLVICAVSGGPDSMCLLDSLLILSKDLNFSLHVAHLHHHMRGEEADRDAEMVSRFARDRGIPVTVGHEKVLEMAKRLCVGIEEAGRIARYRFYNSLKEKIGAQKIAVGHNMNDQAETVFMRLMRGAGTKGLAGIPPINNGIIRPLIEVPREYTEKYCEERNLPTVSDVYNFALVYRRNLVRHKIFPKLSKLFNPSLVQTLSDVARVLRWDSDFLEKEASRAFCRHSFKEGKITLVDTKFVQEHPPAISSRVFEKAWRECAGKESNLDILHILRLLESDKVIVSLPEQVIAKKEGRFVEFYPCPPRKLQVRVQVPGITEVPELGLSVQTRVFRKKEGVGSFVCQLLEHRKDRVKSFFMVEPRVYVDYNKCKGQIWLRTRRPGDRFAPFGMGGKQKKLQDFFISAKVPRFYRDFVPIFTSGEEIVWVGGFRLSERFKLDENTGNILEIEIRPYLRYSQNCATICWSAPTTGRVSL